MLLRYEGKLFATTFRDVIGAGKHLQVPLHNPVSSASLVILENYYKDQSENNGG